MSILNKLRKKFDHFIGRVTGVNKYDADGKTPLHRAVESGKLEDIEKYLRRGANINAVTKTKDSEGVLHLAIKRLDGDQAIVQKLIEHKADVNLGDQNGNTPLHIAAETNQRNIASLLLEAGAVVDPKNNEGNTPLHIVASKGVKLERDVEKDELQSGKGFKTTFFDYLKDASANINEVNAQGDTPLHLAAEAGNAGILQLLCEANADVDLVNKNKQTCLQRAILADEPFCTIYLMAHYAPIDNSKYIDPLQFAIDNNKYGAAGNIIRQQNNDYTTPILLLAAKSDHWDFVTGAIDHYRDKYEEKTALLYIGQCDKESGKNLLHWDIEKNKGSVLSDLVSRGVCRNTKDKDGNTPLHLAIKKSYDIEKLSVLTTDANKDIQNTARETPLHLAILHNNSKTSENSEVSKSIVAKFATSTNINMRDNDGNTALHYALLARNVDIIKNLVEKGARLDVVNNAGKTAKSIVEELCKNDPEFAQRLPSELNDSLGRKILTFGGKFLNSISSTLSGPCEQKPNAPTRKSKKTAQIRRMRVG